MISPPALIDTPLHELSATEIADAVRAGRLRAVDVLDHHLRRIEERNGELGAMVHVDPDRAWAVAARVDQQVEYGADPGPLAGVPLGIKELEAVEGWPATQASTFYRDVVSPATGVHPGRLLAAGAVPVGQTASPEIGMLGHTVSVLHGTCRNPWNPQRTPGGSSGGSASAVAGGLVALASGSDLGGSVRVPAAACGLVGIKPTYGLVARGPGWLGNLHAAHYGPLARTVRDAARYLDVVVGPDDRDPFSLPAPPYRFEEILEDTDLSGMRVAVCLDTGLVSADPRVAEIIRDASKKLIEACGAVAVDVSLDLPEVRPLFGLLVIDQLPDPTDGAMLEAVLDNFRHTPAAEEIVAILEGVQEGPTADKIAAGNAARQALREHLLQVFDQADLLLTPTIPIPAYGAEGPVPDVPGSQVGQHAWAGFTYPFNFSGHPAASVPAGFVEDLPVGLQLVGRRLDDQRVLATAARWEAIAPWPRNAPDHPGEATA
ncbi:MAG TPA: amidase [Nitriliruptorales bacterium]